MNDLNNYPMLRDDQHIAAHQQARDNLIAKLGGEPSYDDFQRRQVNDYSPGVVRAFKIGIWVTLLCAFTVSGFHIYASSKRAYGAGIDDPWLRIIAGFCFVVLAELASLIFSAVCGLFAMPRRLNRMLSTFAVCSALIAIVGNVAASVQYAGQPFDWIIAWWRQLAYNPMLWIVCTLPPIFVLGLGAVQKHSILAGNAQRFAAKREYEAAMVRWEHQCAHLEEHPDWTNTYARALWDAWRKGKRRSLIASITPEIKKALIVREMEADNWFADELQPEYRGMHAKSAGDNTLSAQARVLNYLKDNPAVFEELQAKSVQQSEIAGRLRVSQSSVSRALRKAAQNGQSEESE